MDRDKLIVRQVAYKGVIDLISHGVLGPNVATDTAELEKLVTEHAEAILGTPETPVS